GCLLLRQHRSVRCFLLRQHRSLRCFLLRQHRSVRCFWLRQHRSLRCFLLRQHRSVEARGEGLRECPPDRLRRSSPFISLRPSPLSTTALVGVRRMGMLTPLELAGAGCPGQRQQGGAEGEARGGGQPRSSAPSVRELGEALARSGALANRRLGPREVLARSGALAKRGLGPCEVLARSGASANRRLGPRELLARSGASAYREIGQNEVPAHFRRSDFWNDFCRLNMPLR